MELMKDVTCVSHIKMVWRWILWFHETYSKWTRACLAGVASTPLPQGQHMVQDIIESYSYGYVCSEHQTAQVCFTTCIL